MKISMIIVNPTLFNLESTDFEEKDKLRELGRVFLKRESAIKLVNYFEDIQKNSFYSDMPEFNVSRISTDSFIYIQCNGEDFISKMFCKSEDGSYGLAKIVDELGSKPQVFE